ncbi:FAD-dependent monooxygenase [Mesorhizobium sp. 8]|uniref:FAD-dependent monooxygenase n=1 Tax=Mesorhizobium sp. 8 TaxID=2584466 RepID=UPI0011208CDB|nr:FAD-dependent monooxygenase [Mesorhizobium sp. 8]QDB99383.1 FAD-binding protein [Mesorhizobium sp. 8]
MTSDARSRPVVIAGGGIAGLTAALAFARQGFPVRVFEQARQLEPFGAGLQLSPNATHILDRLGVLVLLRPKAVQPDAVLLRDAATLKVLARIPLGEMAERRWKAPYLSVHRGDLHVALAEKAAQNPAIEIVTGARATGEVASRNGILAATFAHEDCHEAEDAGLLVGADGVWSDLRTTLFPERHRRFSGSLAWRATVAADSPAGQAFCAVTSPDCVTTFLDPKFHLVAYPVRGGTTFNLVAFTRGPAAADGRSSVAEIAVLTHAMHRAPPVLADVVKQAGAWTTWPLNIVDPNGPWTRADGIVLIGDAAHAMTPFAAQGAAMAIEDAATLAQSVAMRPNDLAGGLTAWEHERKARVAKVARRGALNKLAWNAGGPLALGRNLLLRLRSGDSLVADLDWLYGWRLPD